MDRYPGDLTAGEKGRWIVEKDGMLAVNYAPELYFYQSDIEEFIRTKAAAYTMVAIMLRESGIELSELEGFYVAGAFGKHCPKNPSDRYRYVPGHGTGPDHPCGQFFLEGAVRAPSEIACAEEILRKWCISSSQR